MPERPLQPVSQSISSRPASRRERIDIVDIIRGFALFGVIMANSQRFISWDDLQGVIEPAALWLHQTLIVGKFYRLFAFVFGLGFAIQMMRLEARGVAFVPVYLRRLVILFLFGLVHGTLFWPNDILALFAQLGLILLLLRNMSDRTLLVLVVVCLLASHVYYWAKTDFVDFTFGPVVQQTPEEVQAAEAEHAAQDAERERIRTQGSYAEVVAWQTRYFLDWHLNLQTQFAILGEEFLMMMLGFWAGRRRIFENIEANRALLKRVVWWGLGISIVGYFAVPAIPRIEHASALNELTIVARVTGNNVTKAAQALVYAAALALLIHSRGWLRHFKPLAALGRTTLTNYIALSVIVTTLYYDYGLGLYGSVRLLDGMAVGFAIFLALTVLSNVWLARFQFGPAEWFWRSLTYGRLQPLRNQAIRSGAQKEAGP